MALQPRRDLRHHGRIDPDSPPRRRRSPRASHGGFRSVRPGSTRTDSPRSRRGTRLPHVERDPPSVRAIRLPVPPGRMPTGGPFTARQGSADDLHGGPVAAQGEDDVVAWPPGSSRGGRPAPGVRSKWRRTGGPPRDRLERGLVELRAAPRYRVDDEERPRCTDQLRRPRRP